VRRAERASHDLFDLCARAAQLLHAVTQSSRDMPHDAIAASLSAAAAAARSVLRRCARPLGVGDVRIIAAEPMMKRWMQYNVSLAMLGSHHCTLVGFGLSGL
jgi:hypothetical protein